MDFPDRIPVPMIKGVLPNWISARAAIAKIRMAEAVAAEKEHRPARDFTACQYCGRVLRNNQALRAHLATCSARTQAREAIKYGIEFTAGKTRYVVRSKSLKFMSHLERLESVLANHPGEPATLSNTFYDNLRGGAGFAPEGWIEWDEFKDQDPGEATNATA